MKKILDFAGFEPAASRMQSGRAATAPKALNGIDKIRARLAYLPETTSPQEV
jgi:hypothetical protein